MPKLVAHNNTFNYTIFYISSTFLIIYKVEKNV